MTHIEVTGDGPTPQERQKKRDWEKYKGALQSYDKEGRHKRANASDSGDFFLKKGLPRHGYGVHRIWPKPKEERQREDD